jgi:hypothetical protein
MGKRLRKSTLGGKDIIWGVAKVGKKGKRVFARFHVVDVGSSRFAIMGHTPMEKDDTYGEQAELLKKMIHEVTFE